MHFAFLSGLGFAMLGVAYRLGSQWRIALRQIIAILGACAIPYFLTISSGNVFSAEMPYSVYVVGIAAGLSQLVTLGLISLSFRLGPLSPVWCATSMNFIPVGIFGVLAYSEAISGRSLLSTAFGVAAIICGSLQNRASEDAAPAIRRADGRYAYLALLICIFLLNSFSGIGVKWVGRLKMAYAGAPMAHDWSHSYFIVLYCTLGLGAVITALVSRRKIPSVRKLALCGIMASCGSIIGLRSIEACSDIPAIMAFAVSSLTSLLGASIMSIILFRERITSAWIAMIALATTALLFTL